jgi:hypothetical protein
VIDADIQKFEKLLVDATRRAFGHGIALIASEMAAGAAKMAEGIDPAAAFDNARIAMICDRCSTLSRKATKSGITTAEVKAAAFEWLIREWGSPMNDDEIEAAEASINWALRVFSDVKTADDAEQRAASNLAEHMLEAEMSITGGLDAGSENKAQVAARAYVADIALTHGRKRLEALRKNNRLSGRAMVRAAARAWA